MVECYFFTGAFCIDKNIRLPGQQTSLLWHKTEHCLKLMTIHSLQTDLLKNGLQGSEKQQIFVVNTLRQLHLKKTYMPE